MYSVGDKVLMTGLEGARKRFIKPITEKDIELLKMKALRAKAYKAYEKIHNVLTKEQCETIISWKEQAGV